MNLLRVFLALVVVYVLYSILALVKNYLQARKIGLPILISPVDPFHPLYMTFGLGLGPKVSKLPILANSFLNRMGYDWKYRDRAAINARLGPAILIVSPSGIDCWLGDREAAESVLRRHNDFIKGAKHYGPFDVYGPNVNTVNGSTYSRHRFFTKTSFNQSSYSSLWSGTVALTTEVAKVWYGMDAIHTIWADVNTLFITNLIRAGLGGQSRPMSRAIGSRAGERRNPVNPDKICEADARLEYMCDRFITVLMAKMLRGVPSSFLPKSLRQMIKIYNDFGQDLQAMLKDRKDQFAKGQPEGVDLLGGMLRASERAKQNSQSPVDKDAGGDHKGFNEIGLSDEEVMGNLFLFYLAGYETVARVALFTLYRLATRPELQEWICEEIDAVTARSGFVLGDSACEECFDALPRCLALMYETVRLHGPAAAMPRVVSGVQSVKVSGKSCVFPADTHILIDFGGLHLNEKDWGTDRLEFRPARWLRGETGHSRSTSTELADGNDLDGFFGWSSGSRPCIGKKFSQVEFVAMLFVLFSGGRRVRFAPYGGLSEAQVSEKAAHNLENMRMGLMLYLGDTESMPLRWYRKGE